MKHLKILLAAFFISASLFAQVHKTHQTDYIEVTGTAEKEITPDEIHIEICIEERMEKGRKVTIEKQENELKNKLSTIGIPLKNLSVSDLNANIAKIGWWREKVLASANYDLKVNDASKLKDVFKIFDDLKIKQAHINKATHSKIEELKKQNRIDAIKAAKEKSDYLLTAIGQKTGKPIEIREVDSNYQAYAIANYVGNSYSNRKILSKESFVRKENIQFKKLKLSSSIYVKFRIK